MKVLVVGNDARAHALVWKLFNSSMSTNVLCTPGNGGTSQLAPAVHIETGHVADIAHWAFLHGIGMIVPTNCHLLQAGLYDEAQSFHIDVCGAAKTAVVLSESRCAAKTFLVRHRLPTAIGRAFTDVSTAERYLAAQSLPVVIKADHHDSGSGIYHDRYAALQALRTFFEARPVNGHNNGVVVEEYLHGTAVSISAFTDGETTRTLLPVRVYEHLHENDSGTRVPGIGAHTSNSSKAHKLALYFQQHVMQPLVAALNKEQVSYHGVIGVDCIVTLRGPRIYDIRCAMRDQEAQVVLPRLEDDLLPLLQAIVKDRLGHCTPLRWRDEASVGITLVAEGFPHHFPHGSPIHGLTDIDPGILLFHSQTHNPIGLHYDPTATLRDPFAELIMGLGADKQNVITTTGGNVLTVVALAATLNGARGRAILNAERINFAGRLFRSDIGKHDFI